MSRGIVACAVVILSAVVVSAENARERLEKSPRHQEWVTIKSGDRAVSAYLAFPEVPGTVPAVVVIHENRGLTDWVRSVADQLAEAGFVAVAPDLLSGMAPGGGKTSDFASGDAAREAISSLAPDQVTADLNAVADFVAKLPAANGKVAVAGFCWGGAQAFRFATNRSNLAAAFVFYGVGTEDEAALARIKAPVHGFYGGSDARVNATVPPTGEKMKKLGKAFEPIVYEGAGHGFLRSGAEADATEPNKKAHAEAWRRWKELLKKL